MERYTDEALPLHILSFDIALDGTVAELDPSEVRDAVARLFVETNALPVPVAEAANAAVEDHEVLGLDSGEQHDQGKLVHSYLSDSTGSTAAARRAGRMPARSPTPIRMPTQIRAMGQDSLGLRMYCIASLPSVGIASTPNTMSAATTRPTSPPDRAIAMASNRNCAMMCRRRAPSAHHGAIPVRGHGDRPVGRARGSRGGGAHRIRGRRDPNRRQRGD